jgi:hypothetical protein
MCILWKYWNRIMFKKSTWEASKVKIKSKWTKPLLLALLCLVAFCLVATVSQIISVEELPINFIVAFLEAVVTAVITVVLLSGQSAAEEVKERNVKVFEKKSEIFQNYIDTIWKIWEDSNVNKEGQNYFVPLRSTPQFLQLINVALFAPSFLATCLTPCFFG